MTKHVCFLILTIYWAMAGLQTWAITDVLEVQTLQDLYRSLNSPVQLKHWKAETGDPCAETWMGVQCSGSSLITLDLHGLELTGNLRVQLSNLKRLKHLILSDNKFSGILPYSIVKMKHLRHLNLSHNLFSGSLGDVFYGLENLKEMDLSFNYFTGSLPTSFRSLTKLTGLFLQNNQFTGSVIFLENLSLTDLNIEDNYFSGLIPESFQCIINLRIAGNKFVTETNYEPWKFPKEKHISRTSAGNSITIESHPSQSMVHKHRKLTIQIAVMIGAIILAAAFSVPLIFTLRHGRVKRRRSSVNPDEPVSPDESVRSLSPDANLDGTDHTSTSGDSSPNTSSFSSPPSSTSSSPHPISTISDSTGIITKVSKRKGFSGRGMPTGLRVYSTEELQIATNRFSQENFIGEGSLGSVYRAEFADGTVVAVKNIKIPSYVAGVQQRLLVIKNIFSLKHPNIVRLLGHSMDQDQHLLVYDFIRNFSLDKALHTDEHEPLSYCERLQIALGVAQALEYLHSCVPPISYSNFKAENILLNEKLEPLLCDCDLAIFSNTDSPGNTKTDVYSFGELFLELLTGRKPFDSSRPPQEQQLVIWASAMLNDCVSFEHIVDPDIGRQIPSSWLSHIADIVSLFIEPDQDLRPSMSKVVDFMTQLLHTETAASRVIQFSYDALCDATDNFDDGCLIENSFWWRVHMGSFEEGQIYAVRKLDDTKLMRKDDDFIEEVTKLHSWSHPGLISLIGYCVHEGKNYIISELIYPSQTLASLLYDAPRDSLPLQWHSRMSIALQVARGMQHLHAHSSYVKDLSAETVIVGERMRTAVLDVWIARSFYMPDPEHCISPSDSYVSGADPYYSSVEGYAPREYLYPWSSDKDVYSFGILLLVLITGKKAFDDEISENFSDDLLIDRVRPILEGGSPRKLLDNAIDADFGTLESAVDLVWKCTVEKADSRPEMSDVVSTLEDIIWLIYYRR